MKKNRRILFCMLAAGLLTLLLPGFEQAQQFPTKPVRWLVGSTAGSCMDTQVRIVSDAMSKNHALLNLKLA